MTKPEAAKPKKPGLWARIANSKALAAIGTAIGQGKFGQ